MNPFYGFYSAWEQNGTIPVINYIDENGLIELSYSTTMNWVAKFGHFLISEEITSLQIDVVNHWLSIPLFLTAAGLNVPTSQGEVTIASDSKGVDADWYLPTDTWGMRSKREPNLVNEIRNFPDQLPQELRVKASRITTQRESFLHIGETFESALILQEVSTGGLVTLRREKL